MKGPNPLLGGSPDRLGLGPAPSSCQDLGPHTGAGGGQEGPRELPVTLSLCGWQL